MINNLGGCHLSASYSMVWYIPKRPLPARSFRAVEISRSRPIDKVYLTFSSFSSCNFRLSFISGKVRPPSSPPLTPPWVLQGYSPGPPPFVFGHALLWSPVCGKSAGVSDCCARALWLEKTPLDGELHGVDSYFVRSCRRKKVKGNVGEKKKTGGTGASAYNPLSWLYLFDGFF